MTLDERPFQWTKSSGCLTPKLLEAYAEWLEPRLRLRWDAPGVERRRRESEDEERRKAFEFRKSKGWLHLQRDLRPFAAFVLSMPELQPWASRHAYQPPRKTGLAYVSDLRALDAHLQFLLAQKKKSQSERQA